MPNDTLTSRKNLPKTGVAAVALLIMVGLFASVAYAATVHGTQRHDWGKGHNGFDRPPGCKAHCGKMVRGTNGNDTIYGHEGWDYIGAYGGKDVIHGGPGMEIVQGTTATTASLERWGTTTSTAGPATTSYTCKIARTNAAT